MILYLFITIIVFTTIAYGIIKFNKSGDYKKLCKIIYDCIKKNG